MKKIAAAKFMTFSLLTRDRRMLRSRMVPLV
jgi:hypothetical protein